MTDVRFDPLADIDFDGEALPDTAIKTPRKGNITLIASTCHIARDRARRILKEGGMRRDAGGKYLFAEAVALIKSSIDPARSTGHQAGGDQSALAPDAGAENAPAHNPVSELTAAKAGYERLRTKRAALDIARLEGRLLPRDLVLEAARDIAVHVRAGLAGVAAKIAGEAAALSDPAKVQTLIATAIDAALTRLCELPDALTAPAAQ